MPDDLFEIEMAPAPGDGAPGGVAAPTAVVVRVHLQPGAGRAAVAGRRGDALHLRVAAPPEGGRANEACIELLADLLGVAKSRIELKRGEKSRQKRFRVVDVDPDAVRRSLDEALAQAGAAKGAGRGRTTRPGR